MPNAPATIDADYPDEWMVLVTNTLPEPVRIDHLERIAQIVFNRVETATWSPGRVAVSSDRTGGLGSTGR
jgi:dUTPase